jgi:hypothetical protein
VNELLTRILDAHGGMERWNAYERVKGIGACCASTFQVGSRRTASSKGGSDAALPRL